MESEIYGNLETGVVDVHYDPYDEWSYNGIQRVYELPEIVDGVVFRVALHSLDLNKLSDDYAGHDISKMRSVFERDLRDSENAVHIDDEYLNVIEIDPQEVDEFNDQLEVESEKDFNFFKNFLKDFLTHDKATATLEAFVKDGLGLGKFNVDPSLSMHVKNILYMSYINRILGKSKLPETIATNYLDSLRQSMFDDLKNKTKSKEFQTMVKRYREELDNPVGVDKNTIGSIKKSSDHGSR